MNARGRLLGRGLAVLLFAIVCPISCAKPRAVFRGAPVILVSVDTLRADHLPSYGYRDVDTPGLDALQKDSVVFDSAFSPVPLTLPAHTSLFTGLLPYQHGVRDNVGYRLSPERTTLATFLKQLGYATGGAVSAFVLDHATGIAAGFDAYRDDVEMRASAEAMGQVQRSGAATEELLESWIAGQPADKPFFAFLHLYEPHSPYDPPEPFRTRYAKRPYDGEIAAADAVVGRFVGFLKSKGLYDKAIVVFLSDHGEGLGDHGEDEHGIFLYREELRVPLFVKLPGKARAGERIGAPAGIVDVFPTVAALLGEKVPASLAGEPLLGGGPPPGSDRRVYSETLYPRLHFGWSDLASLTDGRHQYIEAPRPELYDWKNDPAEKSDLAAGLPPAFRSMRTQLLATERPLQPPGGADKETLKKLASLGYLTSRSPDSAAKDLPDPKDRIQTLGRLREASRLVGTHREEEAVPLLRALTAENPRMLEAWELLTRALRRSGRPREAREALERSDRLQPGTPQILAGLADLSLEGGDLAKARTFASAARAAGASDVAPLFAKIDLAAGDLAGARQGALEAIAERSRDQGPLVLLAEIEVAAGNLDAALAALRRADALGSGRPPMMNLEATRGDVLSRMGEDKAAEEAFAAEIRSFPENLGAWSHLALLYASAGRDREFRDVLSRMTAQVPGRRSFEAAASVCEIVGDKKAGRAFRDRAGSR
ncbi:MAG: sulfatase-like hydrolase/transferase [Acidobacteriota bacterium]